MGYEKTKGKISQQNKERKLRKQTFDNYFRATAVTAHVIGGFAGIGPAVVDLDISDVEDRLRIVHKRHSDCITFTKLFVILEPGDLDHRGAFQLAMEAC